MNSDNSNILTESNKSIDLDICLNIKIYLLAGTICMLIVSTIIMCMNKENKKFTSLKNTNGN